MEQESDGLRTRRQIIEAATAIVVSGVVATSLAAQAQPAPATAQASTKAVPVYASPREMQAWTRDLLDGFKRGTALIKIFEVPGAKTTNEYLRRFSADASEFVGRGYVLSDLMEINRHLFDRNYVTTVRFGELYGEVDTALEKWLAAQPEPTA